VDNLQQDYPEVLKLLTDVIPLAIFLTDRTGRVSGWTGSAEKMLGYPKLDAIGRSFNDFFEPNCGPDGAHARDIELLGHTAHYKEKGLATRADGTQFLAIFTMDRVRGSDGSQIGYACTLGPV